MKGITLIEIAVVIGVITILAILAVPTYRYFTNQSDIVNATEEIVNVLRVAQNKTLASEGLGQWGVFFDDSTDPDQFVLFKGADYASRDISSDEIRKLPNSLEFSAINLGGGREIVFQRLTGEAQLGGNLSIRLKDNPTEIKTVYIEISGLAGTSPPSSPSDDDRVKDSRHVNFDYGRLIDKGTEKIVLTFEGGVSQKIIISQNLSGGQIDWEGEVEVGGETQKLKIHTTLLNDPLDFSKFSIHRDRRHNTKALTITIDGDGTGFLINYSADGSTTNSTSAFVNNLQWQ